MKLLFLTQWIDAGDSVLGFVPRWVSELAQHCECVRVVALWSGDLSTLPENVDVRTVGRSGRIGRFLRYKRALRAAFAEGFDTVLAHMVPRYALLAAGPAQRAGAPLFLWYTTKGVDARLRRAEPVVEKIFTASPESLRIDTAKKVVTGHGIDLEHFRPSPDPPESPARLLSVGRLTPAKDPLTLLAALSILVSRGHDVHLDLVGAGLAAGDVGYRRAVEEQIELGGLSQRVALLGAVPYRDVPALYHRSAALVSASLTGSLDKVVLEAMACEKPVITCNESFAAIFTELAKLDRRADGLMFAKGNAEDLAERLEHLLALSPLERAEVGGRLRAVVARDHEVRALMQRLYVEMGGEPA
ncbi:MAG: glycosyltransferase family 4 protein [Planctomycetota bacterium]|nr:glycosyltransferase family 4 protein [Planctomycetota bacterium]